MITGLRDKQAGRVIRAIRRRGPLTWQDARSALWAGRPEPRDARSDNETLTEFVRRGVLGLVETPDGGSLIGLPQS